jgi:hypothetical protein
VRAQSRRSLHHRTRLAAQLGRGTCQFDNTGRLRSVNAWLEPLYVRAPHRTLYCRVLAGSFLAWPRRFPNAGIRGSPAASPFERQNHTRLGKESRAYVSHNSRKANQESTRLTFSDSGRVRRVF